MLTEQVVSKGERTQAEIIQAAYNLFVEQGFHGTSMRQIARRAGIALGGIYNHFPSKEEIFRAVLLQYHPFQLVLPSMNAAQGEDAGELVRDAAQRMVKILEDRPDFLNLMFIELVEFKTQHLAELFQLIFPRVMQFGRRLLAAQDELRPIPVPLMLRAFLGMFFSFFITEHLMADQMPPEMREQALEAFIDIYLHGILAGKAASQAEES
jgi:AcrR family transcriptional regulator